MKQRTEVSRVTQLIALITDCPRKGLVAEAIEELRKVDAAIPGDGDTIFAALSDLAVKPAVFDAGCEALGQTAARDEPTRTELIRLLTESGPRQGRKAAATALGYATKHEEVRLALGAALGPKGNRREKEVDVQKAIVSSLGKGVKYPAVRTILLTVLNGDEDELRPCAAEGLGRAVHDQSTRLALCATAKEDRFWCVRKGAAIGLQHGTKYAEVRQALCIAMGSSDAQVAEAAALSMSKNTDNVNVRNDLIAALGDTSTVHGDYDANLERRSWAAFALHTATKHADVRSALLAGTKASSDNATAPRTWKIRRYACLALAGATSYAKIRVALIAGLGECFVSPGASEALTTNLANPDLRAELIATLGDEATNVHIRQEIAVIFGNATEHAEVRTALCDAYHAAAGEKFDHLRWKIIEALASACGHEDTHPTLVAALADASRFVRPAAAKCFGNGGADAEAVLLVA